MQIKYVLLWITYGTLSAQYVPLLRSPLNTYTEHTLRIHCCINFVCGHGACKAHMYGIVTFLILVTLVAVLGETLMNELN